MLTVRELRAMKEGERLSESQGRGSGTVRFRRTSGRIRVYFRFTRPDGTRDELPIGWYDEQGRDGWTLTQVREEAAKIRAQYQAGSGDVRADRESEQAEREAARLAKQAAKEEAERLTREREQFNLGALCRDYVQLLTNQEKSSARHVRSMFGHIPADLAKIPANEITPEQIATVIRQLRESGKDRAAGILRSYLRAAFGAAIRAPYDAALPSTMIGFNVTTNPVDAIPAIAVRAGDRTLSRDEIRVYFAHLTDSLVDQTLRLALLAGGQRMAQLLRARVGDWDGSVLRLWDEKGRRRDAREHLLPLAPKAGAIVSWLVERARERSDDPNPSLFLSSIGKARMSDATPGKRVGEIAQAMGGEPFDLRDIRRTAETMLARLGISRDVRAQLLSHGLSGVQVAHYDRHSYMDEKHAALVAWESHLESIETGEQSSNVIRLRKQ